MPTSTPRHRQVTNSRLVNNISLLKVLALFSSALLFIRAADAQLRLAVLEIQGNVGGIAERQAWTDVIRASAISSLATTNISVIDREQFKLLVNPKKNLSDCADLCVVQLTRELGAKWSLSSSLIHDQTLSKDQVSFTMKLHSSRGEILAIKRIQGQLSEMINHRLPPLTASTLNAGLLKELSIDDHSDGDDRPNRTTYTQTRELEIQESETEDDSTLTEEEARSTASSPLKYEGATLCVSPLITFGQYLRCVHAQSCDPIPNNSRCSASKELPVRCVNLRQALQYTQWSHARLLTLSEWRAWARVSRADEQLFEWLIPNRFQRAPNQWQHKILALNQGKLRSAPPIKAYRAVKSGRKERRSPLAFALPDHSFRVASEGRCEEGK